MRPTWRVAGAAGLWLVLEWYGATSEVAWLFLLGAWILALAFFAAAYAAWNRSRLTLHLAAGAGVSAEGSPAEELAPQLLRTAPQGAPLFEGDGARLEVGLDGGGASRGPAWVEGEVAGKRITLGAAVVPKRGWRRTLDVPNLRRGPLGATGWSIGTSDPLGLFAGRRACPDTELALVYPRFASLAGRRPVREMEAAVAAPRAGSGSDLFGIREYRPGDSLRRIHWRSTARHGQLVVREFEPPGRHAIAIVVDPAPPSRPVADQIARIAASEAWDCLREGGQVSIFAPGLEPADSPHDLWGLLDWLARYPDLPPAESPRPRVETVVVTADPRLLDGRAIRSWLVGSAGVETDVPFERVGTQWPL